jgi:hypothetical protein
MVTAGCQPNSFVIGAFVGISSPSIAPLIISDRPLNLPAKRNTLNGTGTNREDLPSFLPIIPIKSRVDTGIPSEGKSTEVPCGHVEDGQLKIVVIKSQTLATEM